MSENDPLSEERETLVTAIEQAAQGDLNERVVLPIVEESLTVGKRIEETGVVRISKRTTERTETVQLETAQETVSIERVPVDRLVDGPVEIRQEGDVTIVPVLEEVVVVEKRLMLREEVRITRTRTTVPQERTVVLRKEEAVVERDAPNP